MDQNTVIAIAVVIVTFFTFTYITVQEVLKFRLKKEQIKADAIVRAEEIKAKNQLDLEMLIRKDVQGKYENNSASPIDNDVLNERRDKLNERV